MEIEIRDNHFLLLPSKAVYWTERRTLLIGDLHLGKVTHFRKNGIAIPAVALEYNFNTLDELVITYSAERIIFLGDLFHHHHNKEWSLFEAWRSKHQHVHMYIVPGNHDIISKDLFVANQLEVVSPFIEDGFLFTHHPVETGFAEYTFCGHIHPVYCLRSPARQSIRLPCFVQDPHQMILPSFGVFTGGYEMESQVGRKVYVIAKDKILPV